MKYIFLTSILLFGIYASADSYSDFQKMVASCGNEAAFEPEAEYNAYCESYYKSVLFFELDRGINKINELPDDISYWFKVDQDLNMRNLQRLYRLKGILLSLKHNIEGQIENKCKDESDQLDCRVKEYSREIHRNKDYSSIVWKVDKLIQEYSPHSLDTTD